jgi:molybdopterin converting factor small subunit
MLRLYVMVTDPTVTIYLPSPLRRYSGGASQLAIAARSVRGALEDLERRQFALYRNICDETGALRRHLNVFVNSAHIRDLDGIDTILVAGDVLTFLPAVSGG